MMSDMFDLDASTRASIRGAPRTAARATTRSGRRALLSGLALVASLIACGEAGEHGSGEATSAPSAPEPDWKLGLVVAGQELSARTELEQAALAPLAEPPRMARLLHADVVPEFELRGVAPIPTEPREVELKPAFGAKQREDSFLLKPGAFLASDTGLAIPSSGVAELVLRVRVASGTAIEISFNLKRGKDVARVSLPVEPSGEWQTLRVSQPLVMHSNFENTVDRISLGSPKDLEESLLLQVKPLVIVAPGAVYALSSHGVRDEVVGGSLRPSFWQSADGVTRLAWPEGALGRSLRGAFAVRPGANTGEVGTLRLVAEKADGSERLLEVLPLKAAASWKELAVELPESFDASALRLEVDGLAKGAVVLHADWRVLDTTRAPRRVVLLVMDTLRADALGAYGKPGDPSPALDALASEGVLFTRCYSQAPWTRPSMPSIMTGLYTPQTGVENKFDQLPESYTTLAERFAASGWRTAAFIANAQAGPAAGMGQGWDELVLCLGQDSDAQFREIIEPRAAQLAEEDLLLYVHLMEAHGPYGPEKMPAGHVEPEGQLVDFDDKYDRRWMKAPTLESRREWYDHDLRSMDAAIGGFVERVVQGWEAEGGPVILAALSDHGEWLGEDDLWGHGKGLLRSEIVHTPLILRAPGQLQAGRVWGEPVENLDVGATLLDLVGAPLAEGGVDHGRSLLPRLAQGGGSPVALSSNVSGKQFQFTLWSPRGALFLQQNKLEQLQEGAEPPRDHAGEEAESELGLAVLHDLFRESAVKLREELWSAVGEASQQLDAESLEQLRALGYLGY